MQLALVLLLVLVLLSLLAQGEVRGARARVQ
jgi:hypothetical protein